MFRHNNRIGWTTSPLYETEKTAQGIETDETFYEQDGQVVTVQSVETTNQEIDNLGVNATVYGEVGNSPQISYAISFPDQVVELGLPAVIRVTITLHSRATLFEGTPGIEIDLSRILDVPEMIVMERIVSTPYLNAFSGVFKGFVKAVRNEIPKVIVHVTTYWPKVDASYIGNFLSVVNAEMFAWAASLVPNLSNCSGGGEPPTPGTEELIKRRVLLLWEAESLHKTFSLIKTDERQLLGENSTDEYEIV